jgi:hypothetical protein
MVRPISGSSNGFRSSGSSMSSRLIQHRDLVDGVGPADVDSTGVHRAPWSDE